jgi:hypothetical protein
VVHAGLGKHGVVLQLRLAHGWDVAGDDDQLGCECTPETRAARQNRSFADHHGTSCPLATLVVLLTLARAQSLQSGLVAQGVLAGLHDQCKPAVDALCGLLGLQDTASEDRE